MDCYIKQARSVLEYCAVVWHAGFSQVNISYIESVQKSACVIFLGKNYVGYQSALIMLGLDRLYKRRDILSLKCAKKAIKSHRYQSWFVKYSNWLNTRRQIRTVKEAQFRTRILEKSALPYLTHILNRYTKLYKCGPLEACGSKHRYNKWIFVNIFFWFSLWLFLWLSVSP